MNFQEAQVRMIAGEELKVGYVKHRMHKGELQYFTSIWEYSAKTFHHLNTLEWHEFPAKQYKYEEAVRISLELNKTFERPQGFKMKGVNGILKNSSGFDFMTILDDVNALWTEVKE